MAAEAATIETKHDNAPRHIKVIVLLVYAASAFSFAVGLAVMAFNLDRDIFDVLVLSSFCSIGLYFFLCKRHNFPLGVGRAKNLKRIALVAIGLFLPAVVILLAMDYGLIEHTIIRTVLVTTVMAMSFGIVVALQAVRLFGAE